LPKKIKQETSGGLPGAPGFEVYVFRFNSFLDAATKYFVCVCILVSFLDAATKCFLCVCILIPFLDFCFCLPQAKKYFLVYAFGLHF
jgi:hypothetical protein